MIRSLFSIFCLPALVPFVVVVSHQVEFPLQIDVLRRGPSRAATPAVHEIIWTELAGSYVHAHCRDSSWSSLMAILVSASIGGDRGSTWEQFTGKERIGTMVQVWRCRYRITRKKNVRYLQGEFGGDQERKTVSSPSAFASCGPNHKPKRPRGESNMVYTNRTKVRIVGVN